MVTCAYPIGVAGQRAGRSRARAVAFLRPACRLLFVAVLFLVACIPGLGHAGEAILVGALENSPPTSWRDDHGEFKGFSIDIISEVCRDLGWSCKFIPSSLSNVIADLQADRIDIAAMSLAPTPERLAKILLARPYYTSFSVWFARKDTRPDQPGMRVAVVNDSVQARFAKAQGWKTVELPAHKDLAKAVIEGEADGMLAPMMTVLGFRTDPDIRALDLVVQPVDAPELKGAAAFGISPKKPWLKAKVDGALERLERSGAYDRINSRYVLFRVN